jgi:peptide deformylase
MQEETKIQDGTDIEPDKIPQAPLVILNYQNPILGRTSIKVRFVDDELLKTIDDMAETMMIREGIGLAAPQIGLNKRFFLFISDYAEERETVMIKVAINPQILEEEGETITYEGCLSYPDYFANVKRALKVKVKYQDIDFNKVEEELTGLAARVFQHELDHLDGIQFIDRMIPDSLKHKDEIDKEKEEESGDGTIEATTI